METERQYEQRLKVLGDAQHLPDLARIKGQENAAAEVPRIRRQLDGLRGDARINGIQFCPRPRLTENGDVTGGTLTRFGAVPIGQHPRPFQRRENGGASFRGFRNDKPPQGVTRAHSISQSSVPAGIPSASRKRRQVRAPVTSSRKSINISLVEIVRTVSF